MMRVQRTDAVQRPVGGQADAHHVVDRHQTMRGVILMISGIGGIRAIVAQHEYVPAVTFTLKANELGSTPERMYEDSIGWPRRCR